MKTNKILVMIIALVTISSFSIRNTLAAQGFDFSQGRSSIDFSGFNNNTIPNIGDFDIPSYENTNVNPRDFTPTDFSNFNNIKISNINDFNFPSYRNTNMNPRDLNSDGIPDGLEDWDNDGILNQDEQNYSLNIDLNNSTSNSENNGTQNSNNFNFPSYGNTNLGNIGSDYLNKIQDIAVERNQLITKLSSKNTDRVNKLFGIFREKQQNQSEDQIRSQYISLIGRIDSAIVQQQNLKTSQSRKEPTVNTFQYLKVLTQKRLMELED